MDIITRLNWVDLLVVIVLFRVSYGAFESGLSHEIFPLIGTVGTLVLSLHYYNPIAVYINRSVLHLPLHMLDFICFLLLLLGIGLVFKFLGVFVDNIIKVSWHPVVEKFGGLVVGLVRAAVVASIVLAILSLMPLPYLQRSIRDRSMTGMYFLNIGPAIYSKVSGILPSINIETSLVAREKVVDELASDKKLDLGKADSR